MFKISINKDDQSFIKNQPYLPEMFSRWVYEMQTSILDMPGETEEDRKKRDQAIETIQFFKTILKSIKMVTAKKSAETRFI